MVGLNPIETTLTLTLTSVEAISEQSWPCLIWLQFIYLQMDHIMPPPPDFDLVRKKKSLTLLKPTYFKPYVCKDFVGFPQKHPNENFQLLRVRSEIIRGARVRLILMSSTFRIAHLYRYTQNISGHPQKLIWC